MIASSRLASFAAASTNGRPARSQASVSFRASEGRPVFVRTRYSANRSRMRAGTGQPMARKVPTSAPATKATNRLSGPVGRGHGPRNPSSQRFTSRPVRNSTADRHQGRCGSPTARNSVSATQMSR